MKQKTIAIFSVLSALLLLSVGIVYAHTSDSQARTNLNGMMDIDEMDEMHNLMMEGIDSKFKEHMEIMHDGCISNFKSQGNNEDYMGEVNMIAGRTLNRMMGMEGMMG